MEWVETTGKSVEEAKDAALDQLGVDESDAEFVIVSEPKAGLFGRMRGEARVRARVQPTQPRPKRSRSRRGGGRSERARRGEDAGERTGGGGAVATAEQEVFPAEAREEAGARGAGEEPGAAGNGQVAGASGGAAVGEDGAEPAGAGSPSGAGQSRRRRRRSGSGGGVGAAPAAGTEGPSGDRRAAGSKEEAVGEVLSLQEQSDAAREFVEGLVAELGLIASVTAELVDDETARIAVDGEGLGPLVGPGGATLAALQEVTRTYVQRQTGGQSDRILVDVAGYRAKRIVALQRFTRQVAEEVLSTGTERALEPMSPPDRKVVHDTVNDIAGVTTRSEGEDPRRHIIITPTGDEA